MAEETLSLSARSIRKATIADSQKIIEIQKNDGFGHAYLLTPERVSSLFNKGQNFYLVEENATPVGFACVDFDVRGWIHFFSVSKESQERNTGSFLLGKIIEESRQRNIDFLYVITETGSDLMAKFLKRHNFEEAGFHKGRFGSGKDGLIWNLKLAK